MSDPFIVHWPKGFQARGEIRMQYAHVIDMVPTVLDALGVEPPASIKGVTQSPIEGVSFAHTFDSARSLTCSTLPFQQSTWTPVRASLVVAISLVTLGVICLLGAIIQYGQMLKRLEQGAYTYKAPWALTVGVAILLLVIVIVFWFNWWYTYLASGVSEALLPGGFHWVYLVVFCLSALYTLIIYIALLCVVRLLLVAVSMNQLFSSFTINIFPLHPDGSGGLGGLHQLLWISNIMLLAGLCLIIALTSRNVDSFFVSMLLFGYLILFPAILTVWLALPHQVMRQARDAHLQHIVDEYDNTLHETENTITGPTTTIAEGTERLATLQKRHEQVKASFPTWPVEISLTRRLGATLVLPLLTSFVPAIINLITKLVK